MRRFLKGVWLGVNLSALAVFFVFYLRFTYKLFFPPYERFNIIFICLFAIFVEGIAESIISCANNDEKNWGCWVALLIFSVAIVALYLTSYKIFEDIKRYLSSAEPAVIIVGIIFMFIEVVLSPMLISKYSSLVLLGISIAGDHDSKTELILPAVLIVVNIILSIVFGKIDLDQGGIIAYICIYGIMSVISFIATIRLL